MQIKNKSHSIRLKILIGFSQILVILPGAYLGYLLSSLLEKRFFSFTGTDPLKLIIGLFAFAICSIPFAVLWFFIMKKTGISNTEEFSFMIGNRKD